MANPSAETASTGRTGNVITVAICALLLMGGMFTASHAIPQTAEAPVRSGAAVTTFGVSGGSLGDMSVTGGESVEPAKD